MDWCPHCDIPYDGDNETQPCCGGCGHPYGCGCGSSYGHSYGFTEIYKKDIRAHNLYLFFCQLFEVEMKAEPDWYVEKDVELEFKNQAGTISTKRQVTIADLSNYSQVRLHISFFTTGTYHVQGKGKGSRLYAKLSECLIAAENMADLDADNDFMNLDRWPWPQI